MITFKKVRMKNFLSIGNQFLEIPLDTHKVTCIAGENGTCKSSMSIDSIYYALYGKSFRKVNLPKLVNSINKSDMMVELEFQINKNLYLIRRGIKPNIFEIYINNKLKPIPSNLKDYQSFLTNNILKMDEKTFRQLVVIGSTSYIPFMQLSASERRLIIEQLLQIDIFSEMTGITKQYISEINNTLSDLRHQKDLLQVKIDMQKKSDKDKILEYENTKQEYYTKIDEENKKIDELKSLYKEKIESIDKDKYEKAKATTKKFSDNIVQIKQYRTKIETQKEGVEKNISFFKKNNVCPVCTQPITEDFLYHKMEELEKSKNDIENKLEMFDSKLSAMENNYNEQNKILSEILSIVKEVEKIKKDIEYLQNTIKQYNRTIDEYDRKIEKEKNVVSENVQAFVDELNGVGVDETKNGKKLAALSYIAQLLKDDGIKSTIIKTYLPLLNSLIKKYIDFLNFDMFMELNETFEETFTTTNKENFSYLNLSEGERLRIDIAILFAFREFSKLKSSISTNLLILDEFDKGTLDELAMVSISNMIKSQLSENVFIISHSTDYFSVIADRNFHCSKTNGFSNIVEY